MRILVIGNGGREHALLWKLARDEPSAELFATRPNGGMLSLAAPVDVTPTNVPGVASWAASNGIDLAVVGPEGPLAAGMADRLETEGVPVFGPSAAAARIESSKAYAKDLMARAGVPTAGHEVFSDVQAAELYIRDRGAPIVVKASGLAAGKGARVCRTVQEAVDAAREMLDRGVFGEAGREVVVEEFMEGEELSVFAVTDGETAIPLVPSQDHKRIGEGDTGPNTGGMGAYAPVSIATPAVLERVEREILRPTLRALADDGAPFRGLLYAGLMLTADGPRVVEFNCRFGDPETQVVLPLLESSLLELFQAVAGGEPLAGRRPRWRDAAALTTVLASQGYPIAYEKGRPMDVPDALRSEDGILLFHAGTRVDEDGSLRTDGGRVLGVTGVGATLGEAAARSRRGATAISFEGKYFRSDIGWREFSRDEEDRP